jgi:hypothetical protein
MSILDILRAGDKSLKGDEDDNKLDVCFVAVTDDDLEVVNHNPTLQFPSDLQCRDSLSSLGTERMRLKDTVGSTLEETKRQEIGHKTMREPALETLIEGQEMIGCSWNCRACAAQDPTDALCSVF